MRKDIPVQKPKEGEKVNISAQARQYGCCWRTIDKRVHPNKYIHEKKKEFILQNSINLKL